MKSENGFYKKAFSHIYVEEDAFDYPIAREILEKHPDATVVPIRHYKDIFNRPGQDPEAQRLSRGLILAVEHAPFVYPGARVCQDFGNDAFYYTSTVKNCIYNCDYCYMQGMYQTAYPVIFVNFDDYLAELDAMTKERDIYVCLSYDTDLIAMDGLTGYLDRWIGALKTRPNITVEIRTKGAPTHLTTLANVIYAYTISPEKITNAYEKGTPTLAMRLASAKAAMDAGAKVRLCFDPMIYVRDWRDCYGRMVETVFETIDGEKLQDVSVGGFRMPKEFIKNLRRQYPDSAVVQYPFENSDGICHYPKDLEREMIAYLSEELAKHLSKDRIYVMREEEGETRWSQRKPQS